MPCPTSKTSRCGIEDSFHSPDAHKRTPIRRVLAMWPPMENYYAPLGGMPYSLRNAGLPESEMEKVRVQKKKFCLESLQTRRHTDAPHSFQKQKLQHDVGWVSVENDETAKRPRLVITDQNIHKIRDINGFILISVAKLLINTSTLK
ncbi:hypothetical protein TNCV_3515121 [Trichonephila clavipes]|nr:hypothetical protein TNCV_3515121 [Trichonephila clavipes]